MKYFIHGLLCMCAVNAGAQSIITTIAGNGITQYIGDGYPATHYSLALPEGIFVDKNGKVYTADDADNRIRTIDNDTLGTIVDTNSSSPGDGGDGGPAIAATLRNPDGVCLDTAGNIYITEHYNGLIRKVDVHTGVISTICGVSGGGFGGDGGPAMTALLANPGPVCVDVAGNIYIPDYNNQRIRKIDMATGNINTIAGNGTNGYSGDSGFATNAELSYPNSVCSDAAGNIYFTESGNSTIRKINAVTGIITTIAGSGTEGYSGDGGPAVHATLREPSDVFVDKNNYIYIADYGNNVIRIINPAGTIYTIAGNGGYGYTGDGGVPSNATFRGPNSVCTDDSGNIYIADGLNSVIRKMSAVDTLNLAVKAIVKPVFSIFPNPSSGLFSVVASEHVGADIAVMDMMGQCVYHVAVTGNNTNVDLSDYPPGVYFVSYNSVGTNFVQKVVIR